MTGTDQWSAAVPGSDIGLGWHSAAGGAVLVTIGVFVDLLSPRLDKKEESVPHLAEAD